MIQEPQKFYVVRGYDKYGKQVGNAEKYQTPVAAASVAAMMLSYDCKSVDIDLIESVDQQS